METTKTKLFQNTVIRPQFSGGRYGFFLMNRQEQGHASLGFYYYSLAQLLNEWDITLGKRGTDKYGPFIKAMAK